MPNPPKPPPAKATTEDPACDRPESVRFSVPPVFKFVETMFNCPEVSATAPIVSVYGVAAATVLVTVIVPPLEVIAAPLATRSNPASAKVVFVSVIPPPLSVMPEVLISARLFCVSAIVMPLLIVVVPV